MPPWPLWRDRTGWLLSLLVSIYLLTTKTSSYFSIRYPLTPIDLSKSSLPKVFVGKYVSVRKTILAYTSRVMKMYGMTYSDVGRPPVLSDV